VKWSGRNIFASPQTRLQSAVDENWELYLLIFIPKAIHALHGPRITSNCTFSAVAYAGACDTEERPGYTSLHRALHYVKEDKVCTLYTSDISYSKVSLCSSLSPLFGRETRQRERVSKSTITLGARCIVWHALRRLRKFPLTQTQVSSHGASQICSQSRRYRVALGIINHPILS
jgi:hypothetical protein